MQSRAKYDFHSLAVAIVVNLKRPGAFARWLFAVRQNKRSVTDGEFHVSNLLLECDWSGVVCLMRGIYPMIGTRKEQSTGNPERFSKKKNVV
jgi:hypothetical protein